jgi:hypothetical protein
VSTFLGERLARIRAKLAEKRLRLGPPLSEAEVAAFERARGVRLPDDYRAFLLHVGNGGAGPFNGLTPLSQWNHMPSWVEIADFPDDHLAQPCPLDPDAPLPLDTPLDGEDGELTAALRGTMTVADMGCSYDVVLVVSGRARGRLVYTDATGQPPHFYADTSITQS